MMPTNAQRVRAGKEGTRTVYLSMLGGWDNRSYAQQHAQCPVPSTSNFFWGISAHSASSLDIPSLGTHEDTLRRTETEAVNQVVENDTGG